LQSVNNPRRVDGLLTAAVNVAGMIPQRNPMPQRFQRASLALLVGVAAVPLLANGVQPVHASSDDTVAAALEPTLVAEAASGLSDSELAAQIEAVLTDAIAPGSIRWDANGVDIPPTAAVAAVRIPGRDDVLVAVGENVDGTPAEAEAPFPVGPLTVSLVYTVAFQLIDDGVLDPTLTVDQWVPTLPNADRVTVQMLLDEETGWSDYGPIEPDPVVTDFERAWSLREAVELRATVMTALAEPGTRTTDGLTNETVLGLIVEDVGGRSLAELVRDRVSEPAGLDDTGLLDGHAVASPVGYRHGVFAFNGTPTDTSGFGAVSYLTWNHATNSVVSTPTDLLDLLDAWAAGELFTTDRTAAPDRYTPDPDGNPNTYLGRGIPFNGYCPCTDVSGGIEPTAIGRKPASLGTRTFLLRYADGISLVVNVNSNEIADPADIEAVVGAVHDLAAAAR
jgi:CubicO group peptidase (beta-lactamase class C family)